ncbi:MAG TPA: polysaccharide biosynthesis/export family protein [Candidatus Limnocylindria bacterium]|nr:polysaccharide biosynthesis/export family protein [Candidatus Limnocylindria bacterium]
MITALVRCCLLVAMTLGLVPFGAQANTSADSAGLDWSRVPEYLIVPGDKLLVNFGGGPPDITRDALVRPDGRISIHPVGEMVAAGRSVRELESALVKSLSAEIKDPRVTIQLVEPAGNQVHVLGRVTNPGSYPIGPFTTVVQAITRAGGFSDDAARNSVLVFHRDGARTVKVARLRVDRALKQGSLADDLPLSRFDIVYVPRSTIGNVNVFSKQFFTEQLGVLNFALVGWELFHLDRVFLVR